MPFYICHVYTYLLILCIKFQARLFCFSVTILAQVFCARPVVLDWLSFARQLPRGLLLAMTMVKLFLFWGLRHRRHCDWHHVRVLEGGGRRHVFSRRRSLDWLSFPYVPDLVVGLAFRQGCFGMRHNGSWEARPVTLLMTGSAPQTVRSCSSFTCFDHRCSVSTVTSSRPLTRGTQGCCWTWWFRTYLPLSSILWTRGFLNNASFINTASIITSIASIVLSWWMIRRNDGEWNSKPNMANARTADGVSAVNSVIGVAEAASQAWQLSGGVKCTVSVCSVMPAETSLPGLSRLVKCTEKTLYQLGEVWV